MPELFITKCPICSGEVRIHLVRADETDYVLDYDKDPLLAQDNSIMCDFADPNGCFKSFCSNECFEKHRCGAYQGEKH